MSSTSSDAWAALTGDGRHGRLIVDGAGVRAASTASSSSEARW